MNGYFACVACKARLLLWLIVVLLVFAWPAVAQVSGDAVATPIPVNCGDRIELPGKYVLVSDLQCFHFPEDVPGTGVEIVSSNVDFDLQGFTLNGTIVVSSVTKVSLTNGHVHGYYDGISFLNVTNSRIEAITASSAWGLGLSITGNGNLIKRNSVSGRNGAMSVFGSGNSVVQNWISSYSIKGTGLYAGGTDTVIAGNHIAGDFIGISLGGSGMVVEDCHITGGWTGIIVSGQGSIVRRNEVGGQTGISVSGNEDLIEANSVTGQFYGISVSGIGNTIRRNIANGATIFDLYGTPTTCADNKWQNNTFTTAEPLCIR